MRVAIVTERFDPLGGGLERWSVQLAGFLSEQGHAVDVLTFAAGVHDLPVGVHILPSAGSVIARAGLIEQRLARLDAEIVHDTGSGLGADVFHPQTGSRLLSQDRLVATHPPHLRLRAAVSPKSRWRRRQMAQLEHRQVSGARRIIAVSSRIRADLCDRYGVPESAITVIPNGAETGRFARRRIGGLREDVRATLGVGGATLFLCAAHNLRLKGVDIALRALASLAADGADARLVVAGGEPDGYWTALTETLGVGDRVRFLGQVNHMEGLFAAADAYVHPTRWDACSLSTIEASAAALPVITTAMNGASELIEDGRTGFVLRDPEDVGALAACMRALLAPDARARLGEAAAKAAARQDIRDNLRAVEAVLVETAAERQYASR